MIKFLKYIKHLPLKLKRKNNYSKFKKYATCGKNLDLDARSFCYAEEGSSIIIGDNCRILGSVVAQDKGKIRIGNHTCMYARSVIGSVNEINIGNCVIISNHVHIYDNNNHPTDPQTRYEMCMNGFDGDPWKWHHSENRPVTIEDNVWIGEYSAIMKGVTIGKGSVVAAHAVVTKDVPPYSLVAGNPAKVVKSFENAK